MKKYEKGKINIIFEGWMYFVNGIAFNEANKVVWLFIRNVDLAL